MMKFWERMTAFAVTGAMLLTGASLQNWVPQMTESVAFAEEGEETYTYGDLTYAYLEDGTIEITDCDTTETNFEVPSEIDGVTVTRIGDSAFSTQKTLVSVTLPNTITSIGGCAFMSCSSLEEIEIPSSVTYIDALAFFSTPWLSEKQAEDPLVIVNSNILVDAQAATGEVIIPTEVTSISPYAFYFCHYVESVEIQGDVTTIDYSTFSNCDSLVEITLPDSITAIERRAFCGCTALTDVYFEGTQEEWDAITIDSEENDCLTNATIHCLGSIEPEPSGDFGLESEPDKVTYTVGEELDFTGLQVILTYSSTGGYDGPDLALIYIGNPLDDLEKFVVDTSAFDSSTPGEYTITVSCTAETIEEYSVSDPTSVSFTVTVVDNTTTETTMTTEETTTTTTATMAYYEPDGYVTLDSEPDKQTYSVGEELDLTGLTVSLFFSEGGGFTAVPPYKTIYDSVNPLDYPEVFVVDTSAFDSSTPGEYEITISCTDEAKYQYWVFAVEPLRSFIVTVTNGETTTTTTTENDSGMIGDVNLDGNVSLADSIFLNKYVAGVVNLSDLAYSNADTNADGYVDADDALVLLKFQVHLIEKIPYTE